MCYTGKMDEQVFKSHSRTLLLYHIIFPAKQRRKVYTPEVEASLEEICIEIEQKHEIRFLEIGLDEDHVHLLVQGIPTMPVAKIVTIIKSLTARELFKRHPRIKKDILRKGPLWTGGYHVQTVDLYERSDTINKYMQNQGNPGEARLNWIYSLFAAGRFHLTPMY